jgi:hypothetical protein
MTQIRAIAVIGATGESAAPDFRIRFSHYTGTQGGSVAHSLLDNEAFEVRCITRDASSPRAKALASIGAQVIQADTAQLSELEDALLGCWGLFVNYSVYVSSTVNLFVRSRCMAIALISACLSLPRVPILMKRNRWGNVYSLQLPQLVSNRLSSAPSLIPSGSQMEKFLSITWMVSNPHFSCTLAYPLHC